MKHRSHVPPTLAERFAWMPRVLVLLLVFVLFGVAVMWLDEYVSHFASYLVMPVTAGAFSFWLRRRSPKPVRRGEFHIKDASPDSPG